jgi:uncharacterized membrane protein
MAAAPAQLTDLQTIFGSFVGVAISLAGIAVVVMFLVGGFGFLTAGGDKEATQKAQRTLTYAIGGLILVLSAWVIMSLLGSFLRINFDTFSLQLPTP